MLVVGICLLILSLAYVAWAEDSPKPVRIGVLAKRGAEKCLEQWAQTAVYLTDCIPGHSFEIVPLTFDEIQIAAAEGTVEFTISNSAIYMEHAVLYDAARIATLKNVSLDDSYTIFGGVIFERADRKHPTNHLDLNGVKFAAVDETSFGGWLMAWRELKSHGIDPKRDFTELLFCDTHDAVVYAVQNGRVDAGTVRTDTLERMAAEGLIDLSEFTVLHQEEIINEHQNEPGYKEFPFLLSTQLYPEWPFAQLKHTDSELATAVAVALLEMPADCPAAKAAKCAGWTVPLEYNSVKVCLQDLQIGPFAPDEHVSLLQFFRQYWPQIFGILVILVVAWSIYLYIFNRELSRQIANRKSAEQGLREALEFNEQVFQTTTSAMWVVGLDHKILRANAAFVELAGLPEEEIEGVLGSDVFTITQDDQLLCPYAQVMDGSTVCEEKVYVERKDGIKLTCTMSASPLKAANGEIVGMLGDFRDITARLKAEAALRESLRTAAELAGIHKTAATYAHEVNNPLTGVIASLQLLLDSRLLQGEDHQLAEEALGAAKRIKTVIQKIESIDTSKCRQYGDNQTILDLNNKHSNQDKSTQSVAP